MHILSGSLSCYLHTYIHTLYISTLVDRLADVLVYCDTDMTVRAIIMSANALSVQLISGWVIGEAKKKANNIKITEIINFTNTAVLCVGKYAKITLLIWSGWSFSWCVCWHWMTTELSLLENSIPDIIYYYLLQNIPVCLYVTICVKALQLHNIYTSNEYVMQRCKDIINFFYWF